MATYNKRGFRAPKPKDIEDIESNVDIDAKDSTTAEVFNTLDDRASRAEAWVANNQKYIFGIVGAIALITVGYLLYDRFILEPKENEAAEELFIAQQNFQNALDATPDTREGLFTAALEGADGKYGFKAIIDNYSGTDAANLAQYYAGISYLNIGNYTEAIKHLDQFKSKDIVLSALAQGALGDAFAERNQMKEALEYYEKAAKINANELTTPRFLLKAGQVALSLGDKAKALQYFTQIKEQYETAPEARSIDGLIGLSM